MKRLSVRLAAGAAVIILGLLAVAQAQRDRQLDAEAGWDLNAEFNAERPNAPLAAEGEPAEWPAPPDSEIYRGNNSPAAAGAEAATPPSTGVQLASHEQPAPSPQDAPQRDAPNLSLGLPVAAGGEAVGGPSTAPSDSHHFAMPGTGDAPAALDAPTDAQPVGGAEMGTLQPETAPDFSMNFTGLDDEEPEPSATGAPDAAGNPATSSASAGEDTTTTDQLSSYNTLRSPPPGADAAPETDAPEPSAAAFSGSESSGEYALPADDASQPAAADYAGATPDDISGAYQFQPAEMATLPAGAPEAPAPMTQPAAPDASDLSDAGPATDFSADQPSQLVGGPESGTASGAFQAATPTSPQPVTMPANQQAASAPAAATAPAARVASRGTALPPLDAVLDAPGDRRLDGAQSPSVVIHKRAPEEVHVGKPATFVIQVQNVGTAEALNVRIFDRVPQGMRLVDATPSPERQDDLLTWALGAIEPGGERSLTLQLVPEQEGELGSVARVTFEAAASVRTISTRPELKITQRAPEKVLIGQQLEIEILIENVGSGAATNVVLQEDVPEGLEHPKGRQLDNLVGTLAPGESRTQTLRLRATAAGTITNVVNLSAEDGLTAQHAVDVSVVAPKLAVELQGPSRRYLERQATYNVSIANQGTATATDVELVAYLDRGFTFVSTDFEGQYDPAKHAVYWSLAELPAGQQGLVPLTLLPIEEGERAVRLEANANLGMQAESEKHVTVDTLAELTFAVADDQDPIETSSETTYEIRVANSGTRDDTNVQLRVELPPGLELQSADRKAGTDNQGVIVFEPLERIAPQQEEVFRIRVRGRKSGTHVIKAVLTSDEAPVAVTKEESTRVYSDQ